jgi:hypothetical protein
MIILVWIVLTVIVGAIGNERKIGFWSAFLLSLFLSPLVGFLVVLSSTKLSAEKHEKEVLEVQKQVLEKSQPVQTGIASELEKLIKMKEDGLITEEEYLKLKDKIINDTQK